jgi:hypothetical protein
MGLGRPLGSEGSVKPAPFAYIRAASLDQKFDLLARHGDETLAAIALDGGGRPRRARIGPPGAK